MRTAQRVLGNTSVIIAGRVLGLGLSVGLFFLLTHHLTKADYGRYGFVFNYIGIFSVITEMGMSAVLVREMARMPDKAGRILGTGVLVKFALAGVSFLGAVLMLPVVKDEPLLGKLVFILGLQLFIYPILTCVNIFKWRLLMVYPTVTDLVRNLIYLAGTWYVLTTPRLGLMHLMALSVALSLVAALVLLTVSMRWVRIRASFDPALAGRLIRASIPLGLSQLATICYYRLDTLMLINIKGEEPLAYYQAAVKIAEVFTMLPGALMVSVYPYLARLWEEDPARFMNILERTLRALLAAALPVAILGSFFAPQIMSIVPGGYVDSAGSLRFLIWAEVFIFLNMAFYNALNAMNREKWNFAVTLIMLAANVLMNLALIPRFSHRGASAATLVTEALGCLFITYLSLGCCRESMHFGRLLRTLATGIVLALVAGVLNGLYLFSTLSAFGLMFLLSLLYLLILHFTGAVPLREVLDLLRPPLPEAPAEK